MQKRHLDKQQYFNEQVFTTEKYVIPFIEEASFPVIAGMSVLEVGCGEGGNLKPFLERGCRVTGVDISGSRIDHARIFLGDYTGNKALKLIAKDIYDTEDELDGPFDLIIMRDVIEHIHDQERFMGYIRRFLKPGGIFFIAFPPWHNPFGGHQQVCRSRILSKMPYFHLLPEKMYRLVLKAGGERRDRIDDLLEIKKTGISIERFERILTKHGYDIIKKIHFFINPNYYIKFGIKPKKQLRLFVAIPYFRNFFVTASYYLVKCQN